MDSYPWELDAADQAAAVAEKAARIEASPCGYCTGHGVILTRAGRLVVCEYCGGEGCCEDGGKLMACRSAR